MIKSIFDADLDTSKLVCHVEDGIGICQCGDDCFLLHSAAEWDKFVEIVSGRNTPVQKPSSPIEGSHGAVLKGGPFQQNKFGEYQ